jgi:6,7-dimethyl-8-ribityllumazine synthase
MKITSSDPITEGEKKHLRIAIILPHFNDSLGQILCDNTHATLIQNEIAEKNIKLFRVPGALELPLTAKLLAKMKTFDAIIALGIVIKGETPHFEHVCTEAHRGLTNVALETEIPIICGVITALDEKQADDRVQKTKLNKGKDFALSAIEMALLARKLRV